MDCRSVLDTHGFSDTDTHGFTDTDTHSVTHSVSNRAQRALHILATESLRLPFRVNMYAFARPFTYSKKKKKKDMVLLMDPARYKYPPVWVPVENLYQSIMDVNECGLFTRTSDGSTLDWDMNKYWALFRGNESDADVKALRKEFNNFYACKEATRGLVVACLHLPCSMHP